MKINQTYSLKYHRWKRLIDFIDIKEVDSNLILDIINSLEGRFKAFHSNKYSFHGKYFIRSLECWRLYYLCGLSFGQINKLVNLTHKNSKTLIYEINQNYLKPALNDYLFYMIRVNHAQFTNTKSEECIIIC